MDWSTNPIKLARARGNLGPNATEEEIKEEYLRIGGGLVQGFEPVVVPIIEETKQKTVKVKVPKKTVTKVVKKKTNVSKPRVLAPKKKEAKSKRKK